MNEERRQILEMLSTGKITTDEAERLLAALDQGKQPAAAAGADSARPKFLRVMVEDLSDKDRKTQVNVRVPMQLLRAGVKLAGLIPMPALNRVNEALHEQGVPVDLSQLKPENLEELVDQLSELRVDVDQDDAKVRVFCE
jgi:hypothetical protein